MTRGFTLIETLAVITILGVVFISLTQMIAYMYKTNRTVFAQAGAVGTARAGVDAAVSSLRSASYGADGGYPIALAATSSVTFYADTDADDVVEKIRYYLSQNSLYEGITEPVGNPASYAGQQERVVKVTTDVRNPVTTPIFRYYDAAGMELLPPVDIESVSSVSITLLVNSDPLEASTFSLTESATLRNLHAY